MARIVGIPVLGTEQYPSRMGGTDERLTPLLESLGARIYPKMSFGCVGCAPFMSDIEESGRQQVILIGIETHICVNQTALGLLERGYKVFLAADAVGARTQEMHDIGLARISQAGAALAHSESIAYEWLYSAENSAFRDALKVVKEFASDAASE
jgi:nicotinamidase-related amidase